MHKSLLLSIFRHVDFGRKDILDGIEIAATGCMTFSSARPRYVSNLSRWIYDGSHGNHPEKIIHEQESTVPRDDILWPCNRAHFADTTACNVSVFPWHKRQRYDEYADTG